jgi:hypothetical protein
MINLLCMLIGHNWKQIKWGLRTTNKAMHKCTRCQKREMRDVRV